LPADNPDGVRIFLPEVVRRELSDRDRHGVEATVRTRAVARILIVDDEKDPAKAFAECLEEVGYSVETAGNVPDAQRKLHQQTFDAVVLDLHLPEVPGMELLKELRVQAVTTPVIIVTGWPTVATAAEAVRLGAHDYLVKPFQKAALQHAVERAVNFGGLLEGKKRLEAANEEYRNRLELLVEERTRSLRESQLFYHSLVENLPQCIFRKDLQCCYTFVNQQFCASLGRSSAEILGKTSRDLFPAALADRYEAADTFVMGSGGIVEREELYPGLNGELRRIHLMKTPLFDTDQGLVGLQGIFWDVTERWQAEQALRAAESRYRNLFENAVEGIFQTTAEGRIILANPALARMFGYASAGELMGAVSSVADQLYLNPEDRRAFQRLIAKRGEVRDFEVRQRKQNGSVFWASFNAYPVHNDNGELFYYEGRVEDITARKEGEEALRRYQLLSRHAHDIILFIASDGRLLEANEAALKAYGYTPEEMLTLKIHDLRARHVRQQTDDLIARAFAEGFAIETEHQRKDGTTFPVEASSRGVETGGERVLLSVIRDITSRKQAEAERIRLEARLRQAEKMEAIGTLAGGIAHDFNNILGIIMGYAEIAGLTLAENSPEKASLEEVIKAAHRAKDLVKQILTFSRKDGREQMAVQLGTVIREAMKLIRASLPKTIEVRQEITVTPGDDLVMADSTQIHQLLMNLSANAAHAMREKGGTLTVSLSPHHVAPLDVTETPELAPGDYLRLAVEDTGHGMHRKILGHIFNPYFTTKAPGEGTGLGLAVVHGIVRDHHGAITVRSKPGKGTLFHLHFPRLTSAVSEMQTMPEQFPRGQERILLVDDEELLARALTQLLERLGYRVTASFSSIEALDCFRQTPLDFDLVITDFTMPHMTGLDLAKNIKNLRSDIPIILSSGYSEQISREAMARCGIAALLMKPVSLRSMAGLIRRVVEQG